jgi:hypothetical protein
MRQTDPQVVVDRLARRLTLARLALAMPTYRVTVEFHIKAVTDAAAEIRRLPRGTALPAVEGVFGPAVEALLADTVARRNPVPDSVPSEWTVQMRCPACGLVPDSLARCRCT